MQAIAILILLICAIVGLNMVAAEIGEDDEPEQYDDPYGW